MKKELLNIANALQVLGKTLAEYALSQPADPAGPTFVERTIFDQLREQEEEAAAKTEPAPAADPAGQKPVITRKHIYPLFKWTAIYEQYIVAQYERKETFDKIAERLGELAGSPLSGDAVQKRYQRIMKGASRNFYKDGKFSRNRGTI